MEIKYGNDYILCYKDVCNNLMPFFGQKDLIIEKNSVMENFEKIHRKIKIGEEVKISTNFAINKEQKCIFDNILEKYDRIELWIKNINDSMAEYLGRFYVDTITYMANVNEYFKIDINFVKENIYE